MNQLLVYYWAVQYAQASGSTGERFNLIYFLFVVPIGLYASFSFLSLSFSARPFTRPARWIFAFAFVVVFVALLRWDIQTIMTLGLLCTTMIVFLTRQEGPSISLLNKLFLASIPAIMICYFLDQSIYTIYPGGQDAVWWRVSIFPQVPMSAFFSGVIFLSNLVYKNGRYRRACLYLSLYFLIFSGLRSAILASVLVGVYLYLRQKGYLATFRSKMRYFAVAIVGFVAILLSPDILLSLSSADNPLNFFLFRSTGEIDKDALVATIFRTMLWEEHFKIMSSNWLFGVGTYDFTALSTRLGHLTGGSESFLTNNLARVGLPMLLFVAGLISAIKRGLKNNYDMAMVIGIFLFVAMLSYGGFIVGYDFTFLTMLSLLAGTQRKPEMKLLPAPTQADSAVTLDAECLRPSS